MKGISKSRKRHVGQNAVIHFYLLAVLMLFSASGICADANTQEIVEQASERAAEKAVEKATEKITAKVVEKAAELATEKSEQEAAAKQEIKAIQSDRSPV